MVAVSGSSDATTTPRSQLSALPDSRRARAARARVQEKRGFWAWITIDRLPLIALAGLLVVSLVGAELYLDSGIVMGDNPFRPVWVSYDRGEAYVLVGAALVGLLLAGVIPLRNPVPMGWLTEKAATAFSKGSGIWFWIALGGVALGIIAKGPYLFVAPEYLTFAAPTPLVSLSSLIAPVVLIAAGIVSARQPWLGTVLGAMMAMILFAGATRLFAGSVVLFLVGRLLAGARVPVWMWAAGGVSAAVALPIPLHLRNLSLHGLIPYSAATAEYLTSPDYGTIVVASIAENVGFTVPLLVHVANQDNITWDHIMIMINPMPGTVAGWDRIVASMRVHYYIPYSMLGEFASFGPLVLVAAVFVWGSLMRLAIQLVADPDSNLSLLFIAGQLGLALISVLYVTQYNTRNVNRVLTMMLGAALLFHVVRALLESRRMRRNRGRHARPPERLKV